MCDVHVWAPEQGKESVTYIPLVLSTLFLKQGFSLNLELTTLAIWLTNPQSPHALTSHPALQLQKYAAKLCLHG